MDIPEQLSLHHPLLLPFNPLGWGDMERLTPPAALHREGGSRGEGGRKGALLKYCHRNCNKPGQQTEAPSVSLGDPF